jgi:hypothetical protein
MYKVAVYTEYFLVQFLKNFHPTGVHEAFISGVIKDLQ